jgi:hypothetical protein
MNQRPYTTRAKKSLALANAAAEEFGDEFLGPEHLLVGLLDVIFLECALASLYGSAASRS